MSEEMLRQFLQRLNDDESFRETLRQDPEGVLAQFELSQTERTALRTGDEDALRRLASMDVSGFMSSGSIGCGFSLMCPPPPPQPPTYTLVHPDGSPCDIGDYRKFV